ncbi:tudor domain-containing 6 isoform X2 [Osmerus eperlanus]|uniref:tudor domain-containing 6 isoform X2 n=1 Tax=Osmerus eperlanus TaxID=29151 RepID=UPI002E13DDE5
MCSIPELPTPGSNVSVLIKRVNLNPLCVLVEFWCNFDQERKIAHQCLRKDIQCPREAFRELEGNPGDQCLVSVFETWYRARIVSKNGSNYNVFLIDEGRSLSATTGMLAWGHSEFFRLPPEVEFCVLSNVLPLSTENRWSPVALEFLKSLCGQQATASIQDVLVPHRTFLLDIPSISRQMYEMGFAKKLPTERFRLFVSRSLQAHSGAATSNKPQQMSMKNDPLDRHELMEKQQQYMYPELQTETVETVIITEVTNPLRLFCQLKVFSQELRKLTEQITQYYEGRVQTGLSRPQTLGSPCASRGSDGKWYRSVLQQLFPANSVVEVLQVDNGKKQFVQMENIRFLAAEFFRMPVVTYVCSLHGIIDKGVGWTVPQIDYLKTLLLNRTVIAKFEYQSLSEGVHYVTLYGDENMCINTMFGSKEKCILECDGSHGDYAVCSKLAPKPKHLGGMETRVSPPSGDATETRVKFTAEDLQLQSSHVAVVQHVSNPSEFWIQTQRYAVEFDQLMNDLSDMYSNPEGADMIKHPTVGLYCAAKSEDDAFYRATVSGITGHQCEVFFVDYGNTEIVECGNLRVLPDCLKELPPLALKCSLAGIRPKDQKWSQDASDFFTTVVVDKIVDIHITAKWDGGYVVNLTNSSSDGESDLSKLMCTAGYAVQDEKTTSKVVSGPTALPTALNPGDIPYDAYKTSFTALSTEDSTGKESRTAFKEHLFPIGSSFEVNVSFIESPNDFWCQLTKNMGHLKLLMQDIQNFYTDSQFLPPVETACVARHPGNGMWYRALVIQKHATPHVDVLFIDYGQTKTVSIQDLRNINPSFLKLRGQAFRCSLYNLIHPTSHNTVEWTEDAIAQFQDFVDTAADNHVALKCTIYAVMFDAQKVVFNVVDLETPFVSVCSLMVQKGLANRAPSKKAPPSPFRLDTYYYSTHGIKTGTEELVTVTSVKSVNHFYCQLKRNATIIEGLAESVNTMCHQLESSNCPQTFGTVCFAKYTDGQWYRGQIKATQPTVLVHFVDYGDTIKVDKSNLLPIPIEASEIMSVPVQAVECGLSDIQGEVSDEVNSWFETHMTDCTCRALVVAKEPSGKLLVELYDGKTQVNAKTKEKLRIKEHRIENQGHNEKVTNQCCAPKAAGPAEEIPKKRRIPYQAPYTTPHQRQTTVRNGNVRNGAELREVGVIEMKTVPQIETKRFPTPKSPLSPAQQTNYVAPKAKVQTLPKLSDLPSKCIEAGLETDVFISHCNSPWSFFVQLTKEEDDIFSFVEKLNEEQQMTETVDVRDLHQGDLVKAVFPDDSSWYRAVVQEVSRSGTASVEFIDFGNTATTLVSKMCRLDTCSIECPRFSIHCLLSGTPAQDEKDELNQEILSKFKEEIGAGGDKELKCKFVKQSGSVWEVSLWDSGRQVTCGIPLKHPGTLSDATPESSMGPSQVKENPPKSCSVQELAPEKFPLNNNESVCFCKADIAVGQTMEAYVSTIIGPQSFWCQSANSDELDKITKMVSEAGSEVQCKPVEIDTLSTGSPCIAIFTDDEQLYRAEVRSIEGDYLSILFIDYGNESRVNIKDVRALPPLLLNIPPQAFLCQLEGFDASQGTWDDKAADQLSELITDKPLHLTFLTVSSDEAGRTTCFVHVELEGQVVNEVMKAYWKSYTVDEPDSTGESTPCANPSLPCESVQIGEQTAVMDPCPQEPSKTTTKQTFDTLVPSTVQEELDDGFHEGHKDCPTIFPGTSQKHADEDPYLKSTLENTDFDIGQKDETESTTDLLDKDREPTEKEEFEVLQTVEERTDLPAALSNMVEDDTKTVTVIEICKEQLNEAEQTDCLSDSCVSSGDKLTLALVANQNVLKEDCVDQDRLQVLLLDQASSVVDSESARLLEEVPKETTLPHGDQSQDNMYTDVFKLHVENTLESPEPSHTAPEDLKSKDKDSCVTSEELKNLRKELESIDLNEESISDTVLETGWVNCLSEFGRLQRAGENIAVGSNYVIWSIARKTWCKVKVLKVFEDSVKVLLVEHDSEMVVDPQNILCTSSESEQSEPDESEHQFDTASSNEGSQYYLDEDTDDSDNTISGDDPNNTTSEKLAVLDEVVGPDQAVEKHNNSDSSQVRDIFDLSPSAPLEDCCEERVESSDATTADALSCIPAQDKLRVDVKEVQLSSEPNTENPMRRVTKQHEVDFSISAYDTPVSETEAAVSETKAAVSADVENESRVIIQEDKDVLVSEASCPEQCRYEFEEGTEAEVVASAVSQDGDIVVADYVKASNLDAFEHQMNSVTHLTLKVEDCSDEDSVIFVSETLPANQQLRD